MSTAITRSGGGFTLAPSNWTELMQFAQLAAQSDLVPKDYKGKPANVALAVQWGGELGLAPLQALQSIAVINGRPSIWGDGMLALCMAHPDYEDTVETWDEVTQTATCVAKRRGRSDKVHTFGTKDVQTAKLGATHQTYPRRMRQMRARGFALRDQWADVLKGMIAAEEAQDYPKQAQEVRADVVEPPKAEAPKQLTAEPTPAEGPRFKTRNQELNGRLVETADAKTVGDYVSDLERTLADTERADWHPWCREQLALIAPIYERIMASEFAAAEQRHKSAPPPAADPIADGLQASIDEREQQNTSASWGMGAP